MSRPGQLKFPGNTKLSDQLQTIQRLVRGGLNLHDHVTKNHIVSYLHDAGAGSAKTVDISALKLAWTPTYFVVVSIDVSTTIWATSTDRSSWSSTQVVLHSSANNVNVKVMVF